MPESQEWLEDKAGSKWYHSPREQHCYEEILTWLFVIFDFCDFSIPLTLVLRKEKQGYSFRKEQDLVKIFTLH